MASEGKIQRMCRFLYDWKYPLRITSLLGILIIILYSLDVEPEILVAVFAIVVSAIIALYFSMASPTVSVEIKSGINYYPGKLGIDKSKLSDEYLYDTRFIIKNISKFPTKVYVNLNLKLDGERVPLGPDYEGKKRWELFPNEGLNGHFQKINYFRKAEKNKSKMTMEIKVNNAGFYQSLIKYPANKWKFNFNKNEWENKETGTYY